MKANIILPILAFALWQSSSLAADGHPDASPPGKESDTMCTSLDRRRSESNVLNNMFQVHKKENNPQLNNKVKEAADFYKARIFDARTDFCVRKNAITDKLKLGEPDKSGSCVLLQTYYSEMNTGNTMLKAYLVDMKKHYKEKLGNDVFSKWRNAHYLAIREYEKGLKVSADTPPAVFAAMQKKVADLKEEMWQYWGAPETQDEKVFLKGIRDYSFKKEIAEQEAKTADIDKHLATLRDQINKTGSAGSCTVPGEKPAEGKPAINDDCAPGAENPERCLRKPPCEGEKCGTDTGKGNVTGDTNGTRDPQKFQDHTNKVTQAWGDPRSQAAKDYQTELQSWAKSNLTPEQYANLPPNCFKGVYGKCANYVAGLAQLNYGQGSTSPVYLDRLKELENKQVEAGVQKFVLGY